MFPQIWCVRSFLSPEVKSISIRMLYLFFQNVNNIVLCFGNCSVFLKAPTKLVHDFTQKKCSRIVLEIQFCVLCVLVDSIKEGTLSEN